jgi:NhaP-type Na+/H+ or K+/H+ antiporter
LSLPESLEHRELIVTLTAGVVIVSLVGQGLTMRPLLRRLRLSAPVLATPDAEPPG